MSKCKMNYNNDIKDKKIPFTMVANAIFDLNLRPSQLMVYIYLISHNDSWTPGIRSIDKATGINKTTVGNALNSLIKLGLIKLIKNAKGKRNEYEITPWSHVYLLFKKNIALFQRKKNRKKQTPSSKSSSATVGNFNTRPDIILGHIQEEQEKQKDSIIKIDDSDGIKEVIFQSSNSDDSSIEVNGSSFKLHKDRTPRKEDKSTVLDSQPNKFFRRRVR